ncbi:MAG: magnesium transporter CorA family protein [Chloroflexi bacterium]|nr:magnesium transporter CorA family protein [Chloroflexota bacterium]
MITIYKNNGNQLDRLQEPTQESWINIVDPTPEEKLRLKELGIPSDYISYSLDMDERPRIERENGQMLVIFRIPYFEGKDVDIPYITIPLGIILTESYIITVCRKANDIINDFASGRMKDFSSAKRYRFILRVLLATANKYLHYLREITRAVDRLEDQLQLSIRNREVLELLKYEKSLTYFTTALRTNELLLERLDRSRIFNTYPEDEDLLDDVLTENQQAIGMVNIQSNILSSMMDAFASIISNNQNQVIKLLTSFTIVLSFPTIVASFFGMNVSLPLLDAHPVSFFLILLLSLFISLGVALVLKKLDWF